MRQHFNKLDAAYRGMSPTGHSVAGNADAAPQSKDVDGVVGTAEAAAMLNIPARQVRRRADQLGGVLVAGRLLFLRKTIAEHARGGR